MSDPVPVVGWTGSLLRRKLRSAMVHGSRSLARLASAITAPPIALSVIGSEARCRIRRNAELHERHLGKRAFVVGNGPSLLRTDLAPLAGEVSFASNAFWKHSILSSWQPTYYSLVDPIFFSESKEMERFFAELRRCVHTTTFFAPVYVHGPLATIELIEQSGWLPPDRVHYVAMGGALDEAIPDRIDATLLMPTVQTVAQFSIMMALYMGCSPIYLLGLDHDWLAKPGADQHFYEGGAGLEDHPTLVQEYAKSTYLTAMEHCASVWRGYVNLASLAGRMGVPVINLTEGGFLDVFPRGHLVEVMGKKISA